MPFIRSNYPPNWDEISALIRQRAGNKCEFCGAENHQKHPITRSQVVLTVAHLDHNPANCQPENLRALCQRCHLTYDAQEHAKHARATRRRKVIAGGQMELDFNSTPIQKG